MIMVARSHLIGANVMVRRGAVGSARSVGLLVRSMRAMIGIVVVMRGPAVIIGDLLQDLRRIRVCVVRLTQSATDMAGRQRGIHHL